ncbi:hypothetical protein [Paenibacillus thiaminolyticus]|uniref:hypothetical protein n=1 Tax=Paenibacillus thiaminolyticus TaxID=49283 RepID=UPI001F0F594C|nr:hypothetical protein [Paenibacillus thiaminolyticus]
MNYLPYMLLDLELLCREEDIEVQAEDVAILRQVLNYIRLRTNRCGASVREAAQRCFSFQQAGAGCLYGNSRNGGDSGTEQKQARPQREKRLFCRRQLARGRWVF